MILNEIAFSFIETIGFVESEIDFVISEDNRERFEIFTNLYTLFESLYADDESKCDEMYNFVKRELEFLKAESL